ncbi:LysR family transcriptional regulator [Roseovarius nubinhibens]|uniref:LysR family transcriptional regulator n=1 Tax=Roseovarius nubinhibens TaxID=314263 RepID=UPI0030EC4703
MAIKTEMLRCFVTVAQSGNLADAAELLGRTPSAVSMMLKQFEQQLGSPLFENERKNRLTALGRFVFGEARREIDHFDKVVNAIESYARADAGLVRIAAIPSVATTILPEALSRFLKRHGEVRVHIREMETSYVLRELEEGDADLGFASLLHPIAGLTGAPLFTDRFGVVCAADHPLAQSGEPVRFDQLAQERLIVNSVCQQIRDPEFKALLDRSQLSVMSTHANLSAVRRKVGITVLPELVLAEFGDDLRFVPLADKTLTRTVQEIGHAHLALSPAALAFRDVVRQVVGETLPKTG